SERKNGRFPYEPSVLCSTLAKKATAAKSNCSADDFLLLPFPFRKKRTGGRFLFLKKRNKRHCGGRFSFGEKAVSRMSDPIAQKNGWFPYEPSVLCSMFAKKATAAKSNGSADDFLLLPFLSRKKRKGGRFLFLKKRNKRHCGGGFLSEKRRFPAHPTQLHRKTDGFHMNRPFCAARWRKRQQQRRKLFRR
ncbi:MAG: hypothetical protein SPI31_07265, partial [Eubacteriales bacterium]|nr:hypothetical protein [Eubacteriales bacterium]